MISDAPRHEGRDEVDELLVRLRRREWQALLEPGNENLLVLARLSDPGRWWDEVMENLSYALIRDMTGVGFDVLLDSHDTRSSRLVDECLAHSDNRRVRASLLMQLTQHLARAWSGPRHRAALAVLERIGLTL